VKPYRLAGGHLHFSKNAAFISRVKMCRARFGSCYRDRWSDPWRVNRRLKVFRTTGKC